MNRLYLFQRQSFAISSAWLHNEVMKWFFVWNRTLVAFVDKLSSTTVDFIRSEGELKICALLPILI